MNLIREINENLREKDPFEIAMESIHDTETRDEDDFDDGRGEQKSPESSIESPQEELEKVARQWKSQSKDMTDDELRDAIGNDLEQLEYHPEDVERYVPQVMKMLGRSG